MEAKKRGVSKIWKIRDVADFHGPIICRNILFIHAWSGCDTTSYIQGKGKGNIIQKLKKSESAPELANTFLKENSTHKEIEDAGIKLFLLNYNGRDTDTLGKLRYAKFIETAASNTTIIDPALLPPSRRAAYFHILSVYLQVSIWRQLNECVFDPVEWGWKHYQGLLMPTTTNQPAPPENVLKFVR